MLSFRCQTILAKFAIFSLPFLLNNLLTSVMKALEEVQQLVFLRLCPNGKATYFTAF